MGVDLGTANTLVFVKGKGIVLNEPSVAVVQKNSDKVLAVGHEAKEMIGRTPEGFTAIRPLKDGVIADFHVTEHMLRQFIKKAHGHSSLFQPRPKIIIAVPSGVTAVERRAVIDSAHEAGASEVHVMLEPMAAAIGVGIPVTEPSGNMIVDIGGGTTEVAIISLSGIVTARSVRIAGDELNEAIMSYLKQTYNVLIGERTAENIKIEIGSAFPLSEELKLEIKGRDLISGLPKTLLIRSEEVREAMSESVMSIIDAVRKTLERCPPEIAADLAEKGLWLAGGGALLRGLDQLINEETEIPVNVAKDPLTAVVMGTGKVLSDLTLIEKVASIN